VIDSDLKVRKKRSKKVGWANSSTVNPASLAKRWVAKETALQHTLLQF